MKRSLLCATLALGTLGMAAHAAEIIIFKQPNFAGERLTVRDDTRDLANLGFTDQASSVVVRSGRWQVCTQPDLKGDCTVLEPGEYPSLDPRFNHRIESVRAMGYGGDRGRNAGPGAIALFARPAFRGRSIRVDGDERSLEGTGFDEQTSSLVVNEGRWQLCSAPGYRGECEVYGPGRYYDIGRLGQVGSLRRVG
jgi:hypothetical protein